MITHYQNFHQGFLISVFSGSSLMFNLLFSWISVECELPACACSYFDLLSGSVAKNFSSYFKAIIDTFMYYFFRVVKMSNFPNCEG